MKPLLTLFFLYQCNFKKETNETVNYYLPVKHPPEKFGHNFTKDKSEVTIRKVWWGEITVFNHSIAN